MLNGRIMKSRAIPAAMAAVLLLGVGAAACSDDDDDASSSDSDSTETTEAAMDEGAVDVLLSEWIVEPDPTSADAGEVAFTGDNQGGDVHELVVVQATSADDLPTDADGSVIEEELPEGALIGEIEDIAPGSQAAVTLNLESGDYVLFCNITEVEDDGEVESHFELGMHNTFTVN